MKGGPRKQFDEKGNWIPLSIQELAIKKLIETPEKKHNVMIKELGISAVTFYAWQKDENFIKHKEKERMRYFSNRLPAVDNALLNKATGRSRKGSTEAMKIVYQKAGEIGQGQNGGGMNIQINISSTLPRPPEVKLMPIEAKEITEGNNGNGGNGE